MSLNGFTSSHGFTVAPNHHHVGEDRMWGTNDLQKIEGGPVAQLCTVGMVGYIDIVVGSDVGVRRITEVHFVLQNMGQFASEGIFHWCPHEILRVAFRHEFQLHHSQPPLGYSWTIFIHIILHRCTLKSN